MRAEALTTVSGSTNSILPRLEMVWMSASLAETENPLKFPRLYVAPGAAPRMSVTDLMVELRTESDTEGFMTTINLPGIISAPLTASRTGAANATGSARRSVRKCIFMG